MSIANFFINTMGPGAAIKFIKETDWEGMGKAQAKSADIFIDGIFVDKKSEAIQEEIAPAIDKFVKGFKEELLKD